MFIDGVEDNELLKIIYGASNKYWNSYKDVFHNDYEEYNQQVVYLVLRKLKKYNKSICKLSTYIYYLVPRVLRNYFCSTHDGCAFVREQNMNRISVEENYDYIGSMLADDTDYNKQALYKEKVMKALPIAKKIINEFPLIFQIKYQGKSTKDIGKEQHISRQLVQYRYCMELNKLYRTYNIDALN